jgi:hypothetical protein
MSEVVYALSALASGFAAALAWAAKLRWSKEFKDAKDATIQAKEDQIKSLKTENASLITAREEYIKILHADKQSMITAKDAIIQAKEETIKGLEMTITNLKEFSPIKLQEYHSSIRHQLEEIIDNLNAQLNEAKKVIEQKQSEIDSAGDDGKPRSEAVTKLEKEKSEIETRANALQKKLEKLEIAEPILTYGLDPKFIEEIEVSSKSLGKSLPYKTKSFEIGESLKKTLSDWKNYYSVLLDKRFSTETSDSPT